MSGAVRELHPSSQGRQPLRDSEEREHDRRALGAVDLVLPEEPITEERTIDNVLVLAGGAHGGARLVEPFTRLLGLADSRIERQVIIEDDAVVSGVHFLSATRNGDRNNAAFLVQIRSPARVVFNGCLFEKAPGDPMSAVALTRECYVVIESGAKATFQGCVFKGVPLNAGLVVNHVAGPAADVQMVGCLNATGQAHGGVTTVAQIT